MKKLSILCLTMVCLLLSGSFLWAQDVKKEKVILDSDMVEVFDDGIAMMMLAQAPNIDLLGVTVVVGNTWVNEGLAFGLRQLEVINANIPVYAGVREPLYPGRFETIKPERILFGIGDVYVGAAGYDEPKSWQSVYFQKYGIEPKTKPQDMHAVNFIIEQVKKYPGEVSIVAIGTCTNIALVARMAPEVIPLIKQIIYMGGSFFKPGNTTPTAEFNWWMDPEAAKIAVRSPFVEQIIVGLDVCEKMPFRKDRYNHIIRLMKNEDLKTMMRRNFLNTLYMENADYVHYIWDVISAAIMIAPTLIQEDVTRYVDVNSQFGFTYGQSIAFSNNQPIGTRQARIILTVDEERLWKMIEQYCANF